MRLAGALIALLLLLGCGETPRGLEDLSTLVVTLPDGARIQAELLSRTEEMRWGMMGRDALEADHGLLFAHPQPGYNRYWMYQVRVPLDIIWMDSERRIVEISPDTPPCPKPPEQCPSYGGHAVSRYVLELAAGSAARHGLRVGDRLNF
jgi:uncharacterized membrane protein (UPF0127 family)